MSVFGFQFIENVTLFRFEQNLQKLVELRTIDDAQIVCTALSPNGEFLLYSTDEVVRLFHLTYEVCATSQC